MNVIALRTERPSAKSDECSLCNAPHPKSDEPVGPVKQRTDLLPWAVVVTAAVVIAAMGAGPERWFGVGAVSGLLAGTACAWVSFQAARRNRGAAHVRELTSQAEESDSRVQSVIKQFEWAVNDVVKLKRDTERAQGAADALMERSRERERYVKKLERQIFELREQVAHYPQPAAVPSHENVFEGPDPSHVPFRWALHIDGSKATLEIEYGPSSFSSTDPFRMRLYEQGGSSVHDVTRHNNIVLDEELRRRLGAEVVRSPARTADIVHQLRAYFAGERRTFDVRVDLSRLTPFHQRVLLAAASVPAGQVVSYGEIARRIGQPRGSRAVGQALGRNPIPIVIPCHRVVASGGKLGGYTGGLAIKKKLLRIEGAVAAAG